MSYTILSVAYPLTPVGPDSNGGSEQILCTLDRQLTKDGHRSLVIAVEGSQVEGELIAAPKASGGLNDKVRRWGQRAHQRLLLETLNRYPVDLVHMHSLDFHAYVPASSIPTLATLHLPVDWYPRNIFFKKRKNFYLNCVSSTQQAACPPSDMLLPFVRNGIDVNSYNCNATKEPFVLGLGRICPEKGFHLALDAAKQAGVTMLLAGELFPYEAHLNYFQQEIVPRLDDDRRYIGPVGAAKKRELLASASALLVPSLVAETSSLVTMEALASGTPVVAFKTGAIPELVEEEVNGFLVHNENEMAQALQRISILQANNCRKAAEKSCSATNMTGNYMSLYRKIFQAAQAHEEGRVCAGLSWLADVS